jgi:hypothetical protein
MTISNKPDPEVWSDWRALVNMTSTQLRRFLDSDFGKIAGLSRAKAQQLGVKSGRESASWILKMKPLGRSYRSAERNWSPAMWQWARRQNSFIRRMAANEGPLYGKDGSPTRLLLSLLVWGHDPEKPVGRS